MKGRVVAWLARGVGSAGKWRNLNLRRCALIRHPSLR